MYKCLSLYMLVAVLIFTSCKTVLEINVENDLSGIGVVLEDEYTLTNSSKGLKNGDETRSFSLNITQKDAKTIANQIKTNENYNATYYEIEDQIITDDKKTAPKEIAYNGKNGYVLYLVESNVFHAKLYIDTTHNILHYAYLSNLY